MLVSSTVVSWPFTKRVTKRSSARDARFSQNLICVLDFKVLSQHRSAADLTAIARSLLGNLGRFQTGGI